MDTRNHEIASELSFFVLQKRLQDVQFGGELTTAQTDSSLRGLQVPSQFAARERFVADRYAGMTDSTVVTGRKRK